MKTDFDVLIIGGGPAGMASALSASAEGAKVCILERAAVLGGILNQCIHNGFGLHYFKEELTGPEYAGRFAEKVLSDENITVITDAMVVAVSPDKKVDFISPKFGYRSYSAGAIVLCMGCRERTAGAINLAGTRPAGIYSAGSAQNIVNVMGYTIGKKVVILGSGDIGLIMARRMTFEGAKVECVAEIMPYSSGLKRNIVQCLEDFNIPLYFSTTITRVVGKGRVEGVYLAPVNEKREPDLSKEWFVECDTLLLSVGLIPENDLVQNIGLEFDPITSGAVVNDKRQTNIEGIFAAGNTLHVHDLVDNVSKEGETAGRNAALYALGRAEKSSRCYKVKGINGVRYTLPQKLETDGKVDIYFRVGAVYKNSPKILVKDAGGNLLYKFPRPILAPGEMEKITLDCSKLTSDITVEVEETI